MQNKGKEHKLLHKSVELQEKQLIINEKNYSATIYLILLTIVLTGLAILTLFSDNIVRSAVLNYGKSDITKQIALLLLLIIPTFLISFNCILSNLPILPKKNRNDAVIILKEINKLNNFYITSIRSLNNIDRDKSYVCLIILVKYNYVDTVIQEEYKNTHMYVKYIVSPKGAKFLNKHL